MAVQDAVTTIGSGRFSPGQPLYKDDIARLVKLQNWAMSHRQINHISLHCGVYSYGAGKEPGSLRFTIDGTNREIIDTDIWLDSDAAVQNLVCGAFIHFSTSGTDTVVATFTFTGGLGSASATITYPDTTTAYNELTTTRTLGGVTSGDEWVRCQISLQRTVGAGSPVAGGLRVTEAHYAASLIPDPTND